MKKKAIFTLILLVCICFSFFTNTIVSEATNNNSNINNKNLDKEYYAVKDLKSAGEWEELKIINLEEGGCRLTFNNCYYADYRTAGQKTYDLNGLHIQIENFSGDGLGIVLSNYVSAAPYDKAFRIFAFNNIYGNSKFKMVYPTWNNMKSDIPMDSTSINDKVEIKLNYINEKWLFNFNGQEIEIKKEDFLEGVEDSKNAYVTFCSFGGEQTIDNCSFDLISMHGGESPCANDLTNEEVLKIRKVIDEINKIGIVENTLVIKNKIDNAVIEFNNLSDKLKQLVLNKELLFSAQKNYYILNHPVSFNSENVVSSFFAISDNHIDTNGCTDYENGTPLDRLNLAMQLMNVKNPDALILAGDITDWARFATDENVAKNQINKFKLAVMNSLDSDIDIFFSLGNHDSTNGSNVELFNQILGDRFFRKDIDKSSDNFKKGFRHAIINGFHYISVEWNYENENQDISLEGIEFVKEQLENITKDNSYNGEPIFFVSHVPFASGLYGCSSEIGQPNKKKLEDILIQYPQIVVLAGHTHYPLNNDASIFQTGFTQIATATTAYIDLPGNGFSEDGGYKIGGTLYPENLIQAQGVYIEIDDENNIRVSRVDFLNGGQNIFEQIIIPKPDLENKTHLYYYGDNIKELLGKPKFNDNFVEYKKTGDNQGEIIFNQAKGKYNSIVDYNIIQFYKNEKLIKEYKSYAKNWDYIDKKDIPDKRIIDINDLEIEYPFTVKVYAVDSFSNISLPITCEVKPLTESEINIAEQIDSRLAEFDDLNENKISEISLLLDDFNNLSFDQKNIVVNIEKYEQIKQFYEDLFLTEEEYYNLATVEKNIDCENYWINQGWMKYKNGVKGIEVNFSDSIPNVRLGLTKCNLDGMHISLDKLNKTSNSDNPFIGIIIGGEKHPQFTGDSTGGFLLLLNTDNGLLEAHNGYAQIIRSDKLKYNNLKDGKIDIKFKYLNNGDFLVTINGISGVIDKKYFNGDYNISDYTNAYISISSWNQSSNYSFRILLAGNQKNYNYSTKNVLKSEFIKIDYLKHQIDNIGIITIDSKDTLEELENEYSEINNKEFITNYNILLQARETYDKLVEQNNGEKTENNSCSSNININFVLLNFISIISCFALKFLYKKIKY